MSTSRKYDTSLYCWQKPQSSMAVRSRCQSEKAKGWPPIQKLMAPINHIQWKLTGSFSFLCDPQSVRDNTSRPHPQPPQSRTFISLRLSCTTAEYQTPSRRMRGLFLCKLKDDLLRLCFYSPLSLLGLKDYSHSETQGECWEEAERGSVKGGESRVNSGLWGGEQKVTNLSTKWVNVRVTSIPADFENVVWEYSATSDCRSVPASFKKAHITCGVTYPSAVPFTFVHNNIVLTWQL